MIEALVPGTKFRACQKAQLPKFIVFSCNILKGETRAKNPGETKYHGFIFLNFYLLSFTGGFFREWKKGKEIDTLIGCLPLAPDWGQN